MNRNVESHFSELPKIDIPRSIMDLSQSHLTSHNIGELIPFACFPVLPGDTFNVKTSCVVRLQTPLAPIFSNIYYDTYWFFVPSRILWNHWKQFMGENTESAWAPSTEYSVPVTKPPSGGWSVGSIADHFGIPVGVYDANNTMEKFPISLPFRAYSMIVQEFFLDQNVSDPVNITLGDANTNGSNGTNYITDLEKGGAPFKVCKYHDYFTSCLPGPLKNAEDVKFPLISGTFAPVGTRSRLVDSYISTGFQNQSMTWTHTGSNPFTKNKSYNIFGLTAESSDILNTKASVNSSTPTSYEHVMPNNLWADLSDTVGSVTINQMRLAFQLQKYYERLARSGSRYREYIKAMFSVTTSDARMMIPEYLGGHRFPLNIHQVANTSETDGASFLGDLGATSHTADIHDDFIKSFEEFGYVIGLACARYDHQYSQGLNKMWTQTDKLSYYVPLFANIGETPCYSYEIYWDNNTVGNEVFGYQEAWASPYRYSPALVTGEMRPGISNSLASWHLGDYYTSRPYLSDSWIREDKSNVDRVLSVGSSVSNQIMVDFYVKNIATRPMPLFSVPGLVDHH